MKQWMILFFSFSTLATTALGIVRAGGLVEREAALLLGSGAVGLANGAVKNGLNEEFGGLVDVDVVLGRGLAPANETVVGAVSIHLVAVLQKVGGVGKVAFVGKQNDRNGSIIRRQRD